jgi:hypothetical protein
MQAAGTRRVAARHYRRRGCGPAHEVLGSLRTTLMLVIPPLGLVGWVRGEIADQPAAPTKVGVGLVVAIAAIVLTLRGWPPESSVLLLYGQPQFLRCRGVRTGQTSVSGDDFCCTIFYAGRPAAPGSAATLHVVRGTSNRRVIEIPGRTTRRKPLHRTAATLGRPATPAGCVRASAAVRRGRAGALSHWPIDPNRHNPVMARPGNIMWDSPGPR